MNACMHESNSWEVQCNCIEKEGSSAVNMYGSVPNDISQRQDGFCSNACITHPGNSSTGVRRAESSLLAEVATLRGADAAARMRLAMVEVLVKSKETLSWQVGRVVGERKRRESRWGAKNNTSLSQLTIQTTKNKRPKKLLHQSTMASSTDTKTIITLKGSVAIVSEFFFTAINSLLYQRGIYQPESFRRESKYGLTVLTTTDDGLITYLNNVMGQMEEWLLDGDVQRLVVVVTGVDSGETLERWQFNVAVDEKSKDKEKDKGKDGAMDVDTNENDASVSVTNASEASGKVGKSVKEIHNEIQAIIRQITASVSLLVPSYCFFFNLLICSRLITPACFRLLFFKVTFLPLLNEPCSFDLLIYTNKDATVPQKWEESDPQYIMNSQEVKLRSFTTSVHKVESMVTYKEADEWEL